jgi:hypothetical protein
MKFSIRFAAVAAILLPAPAIASDVTIAET